MLFQNRLTDVMAMETVNTLNEAFCEHHRLNCPGIETEEVYVKECGIVREIAEEIHQELIRLSLIPSNMKGAICQDELVRPPNYLYSQLVRDNMNPFYTSNSDKL